MGRLKTRLYFIVYNNEDKELEEIEGDISKIGF